MSLGMPLASLPKVSLDTTRSDCSPALCPQGPPLFHEKHELILGPAQGGGDDPGKQPISLIDISAVRAAPGLESLSRVTHCGP